MYILASAWTPHQSSHLHLHPCHIFQQWCPFHFKFINSKQGWRSSRRNKRGQVEQVLYFFKNFLGLKFRTDEQEFVRIVVTLQITTIVSLKGEGIDFLISGHLVSKFKTIYFTHALTSSLSLRDWILKAYGTESIIDPLKSISLHRLCQINQNLSKLTFSQPYLQWDAMSLWYYFGEFVQFYNISSSESKVPAFPFFTNYGYT